MVVTGLVGSLGRGFPKGNAYQSGWIAENLLVPLRVFIHRGRKSGVQWNRASFTDLGFAFAYRQVAPFQIDLIPSELFQLGIPYACIQGKHDGRIDVGRTCLLCLI